MADKPKRKPLEITMHADTKAVDVFVFERAADAKEVFPALLRPPFVLVVTTNENPRESLRGRAVRNCYWFAGGNGTWAQAVNDRMTSDGQTHALTGWDGLRKFPDADHVAQVLHAMHAALRQAPRPLKADELRSVLEQAGGR